MALLTLLLMVSAAGAAAQEPPPNDPLELQKRAVARIDSVIDRFRRTGDGSADHASPEKLWLQLLDSNQRPGG